MPKPGKRLIMKSDEESKALEAAEKVLREQAGSATVDFVSAEPATWPDASLGWPEPDKAYAQVLTDGYLITARAAGKLFECRVAGENVRCRPVKR